MEPDRLKIIEENVVRVEGKVDKVAEAMVILARLEERIVSLFKGMDDHVSGLKALTERIDKVENSIERSSVWAGIGDKLLWIVVTSGAAFFFSVMLK
jgi:hypothetical protein